MRKLWSAAICIAFAAGICAGQTAAALERQILGYLKTISETGSYSGNFDEDKLERANEALRQLLVKAGTRGDVLDYRFPKLKDEMYVATSRDGRLRIYSWDLQTGGTMHDFANVYQYRTETGDVKVRVPDDGDEGAGSFYTDIFQVNGKAGAVYLPVGTFIASSSLNGQSISTMKIEKDSLVTNAPLIRTGTGTQNSISFAYDFFTVVDRPERPLRLFRFDEKLQEFRFPVVIEDSKTPQGRVTNKFITYRFNGEHFVKVK